MTPRDRVLAVIDRCAEKGEFGRTSLQKVTYLVAVKLGVSLGHRAHFFGPYSATIEANTNALALSGLIQESVEILGINAQGWPVRRYTYHVTKDGKGVIAEIEEDFPEELARVDAVINDIEKVVGSLDQKVLSAAAKVLFIAREEDRSIQLDEISRLALEHGWTLSAFQVERVADVLHDLGLAKIAGSVPSIPREPTKQRR